MFRTSIFLNSGCLEHTWKHGSPNYFLLMDTPAVLGSQLLNMKCRSRQNIKSDMEVPFLDVLQSTDSPCTFCMFHLFSMKAVLEAKERRCQYSFTAMNKVASVNTGKNTLSFPASVLTSSLLLMFNCHLSSFGTMISFYQLRSRYLLW